MSGFQIDTADVDRLAAGLAGVADDLEDTDALLTGVAGEVARLAGPRTPRATGRLAGSLTVRTDQGKAAVRWGVGYAVFVNFGTRTMRARPFATDALEAAEPVLERAALEWAGHTIGGV